MSSSPTAMILRALALALAVATAAAGAPPPTPHRPSAPRAVSDAGSILSLLADPRVLTEMYANVAHGGLRPEGITVESAGEKRSRFTVLLRARAESGPAAHPRASFTVLVGTDATGNRSILEVGKTTRAGKENPSSGDGAGLDESSRREIRTLVTDYWRTHRSFQEARPRLRATGRSGAWVFLTLTRAGTASAHAGGIENLIVDLHRGRVFSDAKMDTFAPDASR